MEFLLENFKHLATTPENIEQLKKLVLQLAIQGKLTAKWRKENPDIESASILLERIKLKKEQLVKEKKMKRGIKRKKVKTLRSLPLPQDWSWTKGDDIFFTTKLAGFEYTKYINLCKSGEIPVVRAQNVRKLYLKKSNLLFIDRKTSFSLERSALTKKCLLVTFIGAGIGDVALFDEKIRWHLAPNVAKMELLEGCEKALNIMYLNYYLISEVGQKEIFKHLKATAQPSLSMETIRDIDFAIPPLEEQKAIVSTVESLFKQIDELHRQAKKSIDYREKSAQALFNKISSADEKDELNQLWQILTANFNTLTQSKESIKELRHTILQLGIQGKLTSKWRKENLNVESADILLEKIRNEIETLIKEKRIRRPKNLPMLEIDEIIHAVPESWVWTRIGEISYHNAGKTLDSRRNRGKLRKYITTSNLYWGRFDFTSVKEMPITDEELEKCEAKFGDLLVCEGGDAGRAAVWEKSSSICFQNHIHRVRTFGNISPHYLYRFLEKLSYSGEINDFRKGMGITNLSGQALARIPIPIPPIEEQEAIVAILKQLMTWCDNLEKKIENRNFYDRRMMKAAVRQAVK